MEKLINGILFYAVENYKIASKQRAVWQVNDTSNTDRVMEFAVRFRRQLMIKMRHVPHIPPLQPPLVLTVPAPNLAPNPVLQFYCTGYPSHRERVFVLQYDHKNVMLIIRNVNNNAMFHTIATK